MRSEAFAAIFAAVLSSGADQPKYSDADICQSQTHSYTLAQSDQLYCCALSNGTNCCAKSLDSDGRVKGCGCRG